jgi:prepilin-type N-terminal cleavage/methylation domain-containing protein
VNRRNSGFTLLELLVVIAIMTILAGILLPSLSASRRAAKANACLSALKGIGTAFTVYLNENKDTFPPARLKKSPPSSDEDYVNEYNRAQPRWQWFLNIDQGPVMDPKPFRRLQRPFGDDDPHGPGHSSRMGTTMTHDVFTCPALMDEVFSHDVRNGAFGYNYQYLGNARQDTDPRRWDNFAVGLHQIKSPGKTVLIADSRGGARKHGEHSYTLDPPRLATEQNAQRFGPDASDVPDGFDSTLYAFSPVEARHNRLGNVIFADSHGQAMTQKELGYQFNEDRVPKPVLDPDDLGSAGGNQLWTGLGRDPFWKPPPES